MLPAPMLRVKKMCRGDWISSLGITSQDILGIIPNNIKYQLDHLNLNKKKYKFIYLCWKTKYINITCRLNYYYTNKWLVHILYGSYFSKIWILSKHFQFRRYNAPTIILIFWEDNGCADKLANDGDFVIDTIWLDELPLFSRLLKRTF